MLSPEREQEIREWVEAKGVFIAGDGLPSITFLSVEEVSSLLAEVERLRDELKMANLRIRAALEGEQP